MERPCGGGTLGVYLLGVQAHGPRCEGLMVHEFSCMTWRLPFRSVSLGAGVLDVGPFAILSSFAMRRIALSRLIVELELDNVVWIAGHRGAAGEGCRRPTGGAGIEWQEGHLSATKCGERKGCHAECDCRGMSDPRGG